MIAFYRYLQLKCVKFVLVNQKITKIWNNLMIIGQKFAL